MIDQLPWPVPAGFILCVAFVAAVLYFTQDHRRWPWWVLAAVGGWIILQATLGGLGFYRTDTPTPRPLLLLLPPVVAVIVALLIRPSCAWLKQLPLRPLVWVHAVRVAVELVLWALHDHAAIPRGMTFEGTNLDILTGLTAPLVAVFGFRNGRPRRWRLVAWHLMGIGLLANVVGTAVLSMPTPFQRLNFDQPCVGVLYFPFTLLPAFVVPAVLFAHLVSLARLLSPAPPTTRPDRPG